MSAQISIQIRPPRPEDEKSWRELWISYCEFYHETVPEEVTRHIWAQFLNPYSNMQAVLAEGPDKKILGFAHFCLQANTWSLQPLCYLEDLFVEPTSRGTDIGYRLISWLVDSARVKGWRKVYWHTQHDNERARRLYERFGPPDGFVRYTIFS